MAGMTCRDYMTCAVLSQFKAGNIAGYIGQWLLAM